MNPQEMRIHKNVALFPLGGRGVGDWGCFAYFTNTPLSSVDSLSTPVAVTR
jgi:hypothetical protein